MGMKFTQIPANTYKELQLNAGVLLSDFNPSTAELTLADILGATDGGVNVTATPTYIDLAEGIDNSVKNTKEGKELDSWEFKLSGTFKTVTAAGARYEQIVLKSFCSILNSFEMLFFKSFASEKFNILLHLVKS